MRKKLLAIILTSVMAFSLTACTNAGKKEETSGAAAETKTGMSKEAKTEYEEATVRVAYMPNLGSASSLFTAIEQGYFDKVGLKVETFEFQGGPAEIAAMGSGDIDISQIGHGAHKLCIQGQAVVFQMDQNGLADAVVANKAKGIEKVTDLKGKTVAVQSGTSSEIILQLALKEAGMSMSDIKTVEMDANGMVTAMVSGQIDACATWSPSTVTISKGLKDNYIVLKGNSDYLDQAAFPGSFITTPEYAEKNQEILERFSAAIMMAKAYRPEHIEDIAKMLAKRLDVDEDILALSKDEGDWAGAKECMGDTDKIKTYYEAQQQVFLNNGAIDAAVPVENYVKFDIMEKGIEIYNNLK